MFKDICGNRYGKLTALSRKKRGRYSHWLCFCDCGNWKEFRLCELTSRKSKSCGCLSSILMKNGATANGKATSEYITWSQMIKRCNKPANKSYVNYGGRGIKVCERWSAFSNFLADMGERPEGHTLDRIDVNKGYTPENCRWATLVDQARNKRNSICNPYLAGIIKGLAHHRFRPVHISIFTGLPASIVCNVRAGRSFVDVERLLVDANMFRQLIPFYWEKSKFDRNDR